MQRVHQQEVTIHDFASRNPAPPTIPAMEHANAIHSVPLPNKMSESSNTVPAPKAKTKHSSSSNKVTSSNSTISNSNTELDSELDKKIRRQEEYLKKRFLKDKTNSL